MQEGLSPRFWIETFIATMTMSCPGMGTETTSSIEPVAWAWARWVNAQSAAIATTTTRQIATMPEGGRLLRAVPYSSPILKSVCSVGVGVGVEDGCGAGGGGVDDGLDIGTLLLRRLYSRTSNLCRWPRVLHRLSKLLDRQRVEHICRSQPSPPRLQHSKTDLLHMRSVVRVSIDHDLYSVLLGQPDRKSVV